MPTTPTTFLLWTIMSWSLGIFVLYHLWSFDRFRCLKWNSGPYSGAFKRVMTYTYLLGVPLVITFSMGFALIKYHEGYILHPQLGVIAKPSELWSQLSKSAMFPLTLCFSVSWSIEMVTHLQELCFWLFLVHAGSAQQDWFRSVYFRAWVIGSIVALIYMPLVTIFTRGPLTNQAYTFLAGSLGSLSLTLWFLPVLFSFPSFLDNLRADDVDAATIVRLTKFHELNIIRVLFRFLFTIPLLILGVDGIRPNNPINRSMFWTDLIAVLAGFGFVVSSGITLVIFFPRSIEGEIAAKEASKERRRRRQTHVWDHGSSVMAENQSQAGGGYPLTSSPGKERFSTFSGEDISRSSSRLGVPMQGPATPPSAYKLSTEGEEDMSVPRMAGIRPNRRVGSEVQLGGIERLTESNVSRHNVGGESRSESRNWNYVVHNFTSPIDLAYTPEPNILPRWKAADDVQASGSTRFAFHA